MKRLSDELARVFGEEIQALIEKETADPSFMPQEDYPSCRARAEAGIALAVQRSARILALAIAKHRKESHGEERSSEMDELVSQMTPEDASIGVTSWWNG